MSHEESTTILMSYLYCSIVLGVSHHTVSCVQL